MFGNFSDFLKKLVASKLSIFVEKILDFRFFLIGLSPFYNLFHKYQKTKQDKGLLTYYEMQIGREGVCPGVKLFTGQRTGTFYRFLENQNENSGTN